ncbi:MAG: type II toxin-antitoxin system VapC family toxin [Promethearchaeota archaeon]|nr:MAG: type II toxin-antitoxin system VapC family toxin [Candidatus Lokiarchaeota archaeon]
MVVLDTDLLIAYLRGKDNAYEIIRCLKEKNFPLKTTIFNAAELYKGSYGAKNVAKSLNKVQTMLEGLNDIIIFDDEAVQEYAKIASDLKKRGISIGIMNELIASICISNNENFYTGNLRHFKKIPELSAINWRNIKRKDK